MLRFPDQPQSIYQVFGTSVDTWRSIVKKVQLPAFLMIIWVFLPYFLEPDINTFNPFIWVNKVSERWVFAVVYSLGIIILYAATFYSARLAIIGQLGSLFSALGVGVKKLWMLILALIIGGVSVMLGYMALIIPGIMLTVVFACYLPLIILDDLGPIAAYKRCFQLMGNHWWRTVVIIILPSLLFSVIGGVVDVLGIKVLVVPHPMGHGELWLFNHIVKLILSAAWLPFYVALMVTLIQDLKVREAAKLADVKS